jgi:hypothetical protein
MGSRFNQIIKQLTLILRNLLWSQSLGFKQLWSWRLKQSHTENKFRPRFILGHAKSGYPDENAQISGENETLSSELKPKSRVLEVSIFGNVIS